MRRLSAVIKTIILGLVGCGHEPTDAPPFGGQVSTKTPAVEPRTVLKIKVTAGGDVTADDRAVTLEQLAAQLADLKRAGGGVMYYRENAGGEPHPNAMNVIKLVAENKLPVRLSTKPDFSDAVGQ